MNDSEGVADLRLALMTVGDPNQLTGGYRYQHMMAQGCPVYNRAVSNSTLITNRQGSVCIDMQRTIVLDVCTATYDDRSGIRSHNSVVPDACTLLYGDIADDHCTRGDKNVFSDGGHNTLIW